MKTKKRNKTHPRLRPGDIVACWDKREVNGVEIKKAVIGWIESINLITNEVIYLVRWSDRLHDEAMRVDEESIPPLLNLVDMIRNGEIN